MQRESIGGERGKSEASEQTSLLCPSFSRDRGRPSDAFVRATYLDRACICLSEAAELKERRSGAWSGRSGDDGEGALNVVEVVVVEFDDDDELVDASSSPLVLLLGPEPLVMAATRRREASRR